MKKTLFAQHYTQGTKKEKNKTKHIRY